MASRLPQATVGDMMIVNRFVNHLRNTAHRPLTLWKMNPASAVFIVVSDAGGINAKTDSYDEEGLPSDTTQGAWMVLMAEKIPTGNERVKASPISWRSSKLRRKVFSTFGGETQAMLQGVSEVDWLQIMLRDSIHHDVELRDWRARLSPHMVVCRGDIRLPGRCSQCVVTDAKSLYDCLLREHPSGKQDRKSALELAIVLKDLQETKSTIRWVPHQKLLVDSMTKDDPLRTNGALEHFLKSGVLAFVNVQEELDYRKQGASAKSRSHKASVDRLAKEDLESTTFGGTVEIEHCKQGS